MTITLIVIAVLGWVLAIFLGKEMLKKFGFMQNFIRRSLLLRSWTYQGGRKPDMYNVLMESSDRRPFSVLVGFNLHIGPWSGFDYYGYVSSDPQGRAVFSTYLGRGSVEFQFLVNRPGEFSITSVEDDQRLIPTAVYPPHLWQRFGFYS